jgi:large exoprotein involved in heme utilization and adhesion
MISEAGLHIAVTVPRQIRKCYTLGKGNAGGVNIYARDTITFNGVSSKGNPSGTFTNVESTATGNGGSINITAKSLTLTNGALLSASNIKSDEDNAEFAFRPTFSENQAFLSSNTTAGQGNIFVRSRHVLLRSGSSIITNAIGAAIGGNIIIDSDILATLEDTSITANAQEAFGGRVIINVQAIFRTQGSNITATSELGTEFNGTVELNTPKIDPSRGLATLPTELVEVSGLITSSCAAVGENKFIITGRGGLPPSPNEVLSSDAVWVDLVTLKPEEKNRSSPDISINPTAPEPAPIVEAQGWVINALGEVVLTATGTRVTPQSSWQRPGQCHGASTFHEQSLALDMH